ncbi:MAG: hypothetical protein HY741_20690 [Chloroflexi bacterium]|nr:hypothetical protein [Chloroflexota bacterium]
MKSPNISRRAFIRILSGMFAFVPVARSLTAFPANNNESAFRQLDLQSAPQTASLEELKARIASGEVLSLERDSIWIQDRYTDSRLRLIITDESIVWKGKYNKGNHFGSYSHVIEPSDDVVARGQRNGGEFIVEMMFVNIVNTYVTVDGVHPEKDKTKIVYTDASAKRAVIEVRPDYLKYKEVYDQIISNRQQLQGKRVQVIGLPLNDGTILASNILFSG